MKKARESTTGISGIRKNLIAELRDCADTIAATDEAMMRIRARMDDAKEESDLDKLYDKLKRFDLHFWDEKRIHLVRTAIA